MQLFIFQAITSLSGLGFIALGVSIYLKNRNAEGNRSFGWFLIFCGLWSMGFFLTMLPGIPHDAALWSSRISHFFGGLTPIMFYRFILGFIGSEKPRPPPVHLGLALTHAISSLTPFTVRDVVPKLFFPYYPEPGIGYPVLLAAYFVTYAASFGYLLRTCHDQRLPFSLRMQSLWMVSGVFLAWVSVASLFLLIYNIQVTPQLFLFPLIMLVTVYTIVRYQFLDIRVVLRKTLMYSLIAACLTGLYLGVTYMVGLPLKYYAYSGLVNAVACAGIAATVLIKQRHSAVGRLFSYLTLLISFWSFFYFLWLRVETNSAQADVLARTCMIAVLLMPPAFMHFALLLTQHPYRRWHVAFQYALSFLLAATAYSSWFSPGLGSFLVFPFWPLPGPSFILHFFQMMVLIHWGLYLLWQAGNQSEGRQHIQLRWAFWGYLVGWYSGFANYLVWFRIPVPPILNAFVSFYVFAIAYAIVKHQLLDIRIVLRKSLVYSGLIAIITAAYLVMVLVTERWFAGFFGYRSLVATMVVAGLIALGFNPLRDRLQGLIDRALFTGTPPELAAQREQLLVEVRKGEQLKAVATLAAGLAHEVKNPLAAIKTFTEHLTTHYDDPAFRQKFQTIVGGEVERINRIVQQLLEFAKPVPPKLAPLQLVPLLEQTLDFLGQDCLSRHITITRDYQSPGPLLGDASQLKQVVLNLILNSLEAMNGQGGRLTLTTRQEGADLVCTLTDTGTGIAPEHLAHLGEPFYTTKPTGTGLGLAVVQGIVKEHGGRFTLTSQVGRGTSVELRLPLAIHLAARVEP